MNDDAPNTPKINAQMDAIKRVRAAGALPVGWAVGEIPPPTANALQKAGLATITVTATGRTITPKEQP